MPLTQEQKILYKKIDEILWRDWDPIGVNEFEEARDEYQTYTSQIFMFKINGVDRDTIAKHLCKIESEQMGLGEDFPNCLKVADKILAL